MSDKINKINIGGKEYSLPSGSTSHVEGNALVINNSGSGGSDSGVTTEEYKTLTITLNSTDNVKGEKVNNTIPYSMSNEQYNKLSNLRCSEIKHIYLKSSNEFKYQDGSGSELYENKIYFTPTWTTYEENIVGETPEDEIYPRLTTISGTHCDVSRSDIILFMVALNDWSNTFFIKSLSTTYTSNVESLIDDGLNHSIVGVTTVLTLNIVYK